MGFLYLVHVIRDPLKNKNTHTHTDWHTSHLHKHTLIFYLYVYGNTCIHFQIAFLSHIRQTKQKQSNFLSLMVSHILTTNKQTTITTTTATKRTNKQI